NPNHFHLILKPLTDNGGGEYLRRLIGGYTRYFNEKNRRSGVLFQGRTKRRLITTNEYLMYCGVYVNLNSQVHQLKDNSLTRSSLNTYGSRSDFCNHEILTANFLSIDRYKEECRALIPQIIARKKQSKELSSL